MTSARAQTRCLASKTNGVQMASQYAASLLSVGGYAATGIAAVWQVSIFHGMASSELTDSGRAQRRAAARCWISIAENELIVLGRFGENEGQGL